MKRSEMQAESDCDAPLPRRGCNRSGLWTLVLFWGALLLVAAGAFVLYTRTTRAHTLSLLLECRGFTNVEMTPNKIRQIEPCIPLLIEMHQRAVRETAGLTEDELLATGGYERVKARMRYWSALQYAESLTSDRRATQYIQRHVRSENVWWSEWPYESNPNIPEQWRNTEGSTAREDMR